MWCQYSRKVVEMIHFYYLSQMKLEIIGLCH